MEARRVNAASVHGRAGSPPCRCRLRSFRCAFVGRRRKGPGKLTAGMSSPGRSASDSRLHSKGRDVDSRARADSHTIDWEIATTKDERAAVPGERFRVYRRRGYHLPGPSRPRRARAEGGLLQVEAGEDALLVISGQDRDACACEMPLPCASFLAVELPAGLNSRECNGTCNAVAMRPHLSLQGPSGRSARYRGA